MENISNSIEDSARDDILFSIKDYLANKTDTTTRHIIERGIWNNIGNRIGVSIETNIRTNVISSVI